MIDRHDDCATNAMTRMTADDAVGRNSRLTLLRRCLLMVVVGRRMMKHLASAAEQLQAVVRGTTKGRPGVNE